MDFTKEEQTEIMEYIILKEDISTDPDMSTQEIEDILDNNRSTAVLDYLEALEKVPSLEDEFIEKIRKFKPSFKLTGDEYIKSVSFIES